MNLYNPIEQPARIMLVHAASMAQPVDVYLNDRPIIRGLAYNQSTQYIPVPKGQYNVKIYSTSGNQLLLNQNLDVEGTKVITVTTKDGTDTLILKVTDEKMDTYDQVMPYMQPQIMPQEMKPNEMQPPMMPYMQQGMPNEMQPPMMPYMQQGMQNEMQPMMQQYGMAPKMDMSETMPKQPQSIFNQQNCGCGMGYPCQYGYQQQPTPYQMPGKRDSELTEGSMVRFIHFSPNAPAVDITLPDGTVLFSNVPYQAVTDYINVAPGTYTLQVRPAGMDQVVLTVPNVVLNPNDMISIYATGLVNGTPGLEAFVLNDRKMMI